MRVCFAGEPRLDVATREAPSSSLASHMCNKMSDVRLSNASPVERVEARAPDSARSARRALFGAPDRGEARRYAAAQLRESAQQFRERYNFDLAEDRPLAGDYEWVEDADAPEFYRRSPRRTRAAGAAGSRKRPSEAADSSSDESSCKRNKSHSDEGGKKEEDEDHSGRSEEEEAEGGRREEEVPR